MSDRFANFKFEWRTDAQNNEAIWFLNPWTNGWEELAMIKWCCHPPEKLQEVDAFFEALQSSWVNALQLTESNRQLREELEKVKAHNHELAEAGAKVSACLSDSLKLITRFRSALAAAKEALRRIATFSVPATVIARDALARIAECEARKVTLFSGSSDCPAPSAPESPAGSEPSPSVPGQDTATPRQAPEPL